MYDIVSSLFIIHTTYDLDHYSLAPSHISLHVFHYNIVLHIVNTLHEKYKIKRLRFNNIQNYTLNWIRLHNTCYVHKHNITHEVN